MAIGFDIEWRPNLRPGQPMNRVALVQLAIAQSVFLLHVKHLYGRYPITLANLLASPTVTKVGVGILEDLHKLHQDYKIPYGAYWDLGAAAKRVFYAEQQQMKYGLAAMYEHFFNVRLSKARAVRMSNWEAYPLSADQVQYAAWDALSALHVYYYLDEQKNAFAVDEDGVEEGDEQQEQVEVEVQVEVQQEEECGVVKDETATDNTSEQQTPIPPGTEAEAEAMGATAVAAVTVTAQGSTAPKARSGGGNFAMLRTSNARRRIYSLLRTPPSTSGVSASSSTGTASTTSTSTSTSTTAGRASYKDALREAEESYETMHILCDYIANVETWEDMCCPHNSASQSLLQYCHRLHVNASLSWGIFFDTVPSVEKLIQRVGIHNTMNSFKGTMEGTTGGAATIASDAPEGAEQATALAELLQHDSSGMSSGSSNSNSSGRKRGVIGIVVINGRLMGWAIGRTRAEALNTVSTDVLADLFGIQRYAPSRFRGCSGIYSLI